MGTVISQGLSMTLLTLLTLSVSVSAHPGGYWWMGRDGAFDGPTNNIQPGNNSPPQQISQSAGGYYGKQPAPRPSPSPQISLGQKLPGVAAEPEELPVTECPVGWKCVAELFCDVTACPVVTVLPPIQLCANRKSTCWSAGLQDLDCLDNALCCFDGCANVCLGRGSVAGNPGPQNIPRQTTAPPAVNSPQLNLQENFAEKIPTNQASGPAFSPQVSTPPTSLASTQPFVTCPSAMKCVPRNNCDCNGVKVNTNVLLSPIQEKQRVPLIPCINPARGNAVDVCCRDPNYKDPWPEMQKQKKTSPQKLQSLGRPSEPGQPNIAINQRVSSPGQAPPKRKTTGGYGR